MKYLDSIPISRAPRGLEEQMKRQVSSKLTINSKLTFMSKILIVFSFLFATVVNTASAQSFAAIGAASTTTTTSTAADPIWGYWNSFRYQVIYTAAELTTAGIPAYSNIGSLGFSIAGDYGGGNLLGYTIKMGGTTTANCAAHVTSPTTTVKNAFSYNPTVTTVGNFDMITLDVPFQWDGTSNILIDICSSGLNPYTSPYGQVRTIATTTTNGARSAGADGSNQCGVNTSTVVNNKPAIRFGYTAGVAPSCLPPTAVSSSSVTTSGAIVSWTASTSNPANGYDIEVRTSGAAGSGASGLVLSTGTTNTTFTFNTLSANTNYTVYVRANCGASDQSTWASTTFYTGYCVSTSTSAANGHIASFATVGEVQDITNNATGGSAGGYGNYTAQAVMAAPGDAVNFTATINSSSGFRIWVDYNNDLTFADPAERVYASAAYVTSVTNSFTIPAGTAPGSYRMRIRSDWNSTTPAVCGNISAGETEDYTLTVVGPCSAAPNAPTVAATVSTFCQGGATVLNGSAFGAYSGFTHQWKSSTTAGGPYSIVVPPGSLTCNYTFNMTDLYSDGWNGGLIQVRDAANAVVGTLGSTFTNGGSASQSVTLTSGQAYTLFWSTAGLYPEEMGMTVVDPTGATVYTLAYNSQASALTTLATVNASCPSTYGQQASFNPGILPAGTYYYVLQSTCPNGGASATSSQLTITVNALPNVAISGPNGGAFCGTQSMTASGASTYTWAPANKVSALNGASVFFVGTSNSSITVTGVDANGCTATSPAFAVTYTAPTDITLTSSVTNFCGTGGTAVITATSGAAYTYTYDVVGGDATLSNAAAASVDANMTVTSAIRVTGNEAATGCSSQAVKSVGVYPLPTATVTTTASGVCPGTAATINSGLSAGNFTVSSIPWTASTAPANAGVLMNNGTAVTALSGGSLDDGGWGGIPIGFNFNFFGTNFNNLACGTNGLVMFGTVPGYTTSPGQLGQYSFSGSATNCTPAGPATGRYFPNCNNPGNIIALMAADGHAGTSTNGSIKYWTEGYAPNRIFNLKYNNYNFYSANPQFTATLRLYETTGIVDIIIDSKTYSNTAIVGLQDATKTIGAVAPNRPTSATNTVAAWTVAAGSGEAWRFSPPANYAVNWFANGTQLPAQVTSPSNGFNEFSYAVSPSVTTDYSIIYTNTLTGCANSAGSAEVTMEVLSSTAPTGVTTIATDSTVCSGIGFDLSTSFTGITDGQTYQWQVSTDAGLTWNDILDDTLITASGITQTVASSYRIGISQCGGTVSYSSPLAITLNPYQDCYCTPGYTTGTGVGDLISNVEIAGTTLANNTGFVQGTPSFTYYTGQANYTASLLPSSSYNVNVSTGEWGSQGFAAWIDYNDDGIFTTSVNPLLNERIGFTPTTIGTGLTSGQVNASASFTITLACTPPAGDHRMRVRCAYATNGGNIDPCLTYTYGETEDYLVTIQAAPTCPNPGAMTVPSATTNANDVTLQWLTGCSTATNYDFEYGPAGFTAGTGTSVSGTVALSATGDTATYVLSGLNSLTDYTVYYRANCGTGDYSAWSLVPTNFTTAPSCFPPSAVTVTNVTTSGATVTWTSNPLSPSASYQYVLSQTNTAPVNGVVVGTVDLADTTVTLTGLTSMTTYYMWVRSDCGAGDRSVWTSVATIAVNPCMPGYTSGTAAGDMIARVSITGTTLSNYSGFAAGDPSYEYFAPNTDSTTATMNAGGTYSVNVSTGEWGDQGFAAWIDYNDDGIFTTSVDPLLNERIGFTPTVIGSGFTPGAINASASFTINLGCTPPVGTHRMRVRCVYFQNGGLIDPCNTQSYGQTEDYMVNIAPVVPFAPTFTASSATACTGASAAVVYTTQAGQTSYTWSYLDNANNALVSGTDYSVVYNATNESSTVTWLTAGARKVQVNYNNPAGCPSTGAASVNTTVTLQTVPGSLLFTANAANTGGTVTYNASGAIGSIAGGWQKSIDGGTTWTAISPNGPNSYNYNNLTVETKFRVLVTNGTCSTLPTNVITGYVPGAGVANAVAVNTIGQFGTGVQTSYTTNLANVAGNEVWFTFTAAANAARISVVGSGSVADDNQISLYDGPASTPMIPILTENDVVTGAQGAAADAGSEILLTDQLIPGNQYYFSVKNNNATAGQVSIVISYLRSSEADILPYTSYTGVYNNTCQNFKAKFRANSAGYTVKRWANQTDANTAVATGAGTPSWVYAIPAGTGTVASTICQLGRILPANILSGSALTYYVTVDAAYNLADAFGNMNALTAAGSVVSAVGLNSEADLNVRASDRCPAFKSATTGSITTNRSVCGVRNYDYEFAKVLPTVDLPINVAGPVGGSRVLALNTVAGIGNGQTYDVRIRGKHVDNATNSNYGTVACVKTTGVAGMPTIEDEGVIAERSFNGVTTSIYPNPNNGSSVNLNVDGMEGELQVRITDATGRMVYSNRYIVEGAINTTMDFGQTLAGGVYMVEMVQNGQLNTMRMVVNR